MKICPFCAEEIQDAAIKCRYCGSNLAAIDPNGTDSAGTEEASAQDASVAQEKIYYSEGAITITSSRAILGAKTYAMANITSVSMGERNSGAGCGCALLAFGGMCSFGLFSSATLVFGLFGLVMLFAGFMMMNQKTFVVCIGSASGEANALENPNREYIQKIVNAVNQAIVERR